MYRSTISWPVSQQLLAYPMCVDCSIGAKKSANLALLEQNYFCLFLSDLNVWTECVEDACGNHSLDDSGAKEKSTSDEFTLVDVKVWVFAVTALA